MHGNLFLTDQPFREMNKSAHPSRKIMYVYKTFQQIIFGITLKNKNQFTII